MNENEEFQYAPETQETPKEAKVGQGVETRYMFVSEVADVLRVSRMTVYRMVHAGSLRSNRIGRRIRVFGPDVERLSEPSYQPQD